MFKQVLFYITLDQNIIGYSYKLISVEIEKKKLSRDFLGAIKMDYIMVNQFQNTVGCNLINVNKPQISYFGTNMYT